MDTSWPHQKLPSVLIKGIMFSQRDIEVECKPILPTSYPVSDIIPLRLLMTSESREALGLVAVPGVIDVRLFKVMGFGEKGKVVKPFSRSSYRRTDLAAEAIWELDGYPKELSPSEAHPQTRWRISLNGELRRKAGIQSIPSFDGPHILTKYVVCLYPFCMADFRHASDPNKPGFMGNIPLMRQP